MSTKISGSMDVTDLDQGARKRPRNLNYKEISGSLYCIGDQYTVEDTTNRYKKGGGLLIIDNKEYIIEKELYI